jgi:acyl carrier protein
MTTDATAARAALRAWVADHARDVEPGELTDTTALFEDGVLTSLRFPELILLIERLRGREIDVTALAPGDFRDIATIVERFVEDGARA